MYLPRHTPGADSKACIGKLTLDYSTELIYLNVMIFVLLISLSVGLISRIKLVFKLVFNYNSSSQYMFSSRQFGVNSRTISMLRSRFQASGQNRDRQLTGRPRKTTLRQDRYLVLMYRRNR